MKNINVLASATTARCIVSSIVLLTAAASAQAATVLLQAESFTSTTAPGFNTTTGDTAASGGAFIKTAGDNTAASPSETATYTVTFAQAGTYTLYLRALAEGSDTTTQTGNDSFFTPTDFGNAPSFGTRVNEIQLTTPEPAQFHWINLFTGTGLEFGGQISPGDRGTGQYVVSAGAVGVPQTFVIGGRESGLRLDAFVFDTVSNLTAAQLNTIAAIPEPSAVVFGALGLLGLSIRRRR